MRIFYPQLANLRCVNTRITSMRLLHPTEIKRTSCHVTVSHYHDNTTCTCNSDNTIMLNVKHSYKDPVFCFTGMELSWVCEWCSRLCGPNLQTGRRDLWLDVWGLNDWVYRWGPTFSSSLPRNVPVYWFCRDRTTITSESIKRYRAVVFNTV